MKLPPRPVLYPLLIALGLPIGILWYFSIEKWDQYGYEYRQRGDYHSGIVSWAEMRRRNLERIVSGKTRFEDNPGISPDISGLKEGERRDRPHLQDKIKKFKAVEAFNARQAAKYYRAWRFTWFLPVFPDPKPPELP